MKEFVMSDPVWLLPLILFLAGYAVVVFRRPVLGAAAVIFLLPAYLLRIRLLTELPTNLFEVTALVFLSVMVVRVVLKKEKPDVPPMLALGGGLLLLGAAGAALAALLSDQIFVGRTHAVLGSLKGFILIPLLFTGALAFLGRFRENREKLLSAYVFSATAVAVVSVFFGFLAWTSPACPAASFCEALTYDLRLRGIYLSPNHLAMYVMPALMLTGVSLVRRKDDLMAQRRLIWTLSAMFVLALALSLSKSAGAVVGLFGGIGVFWALQQKKRQQRTIKALSFLFVLLLLFGITTALFGAGFADNAWETGWRSPIASRLMIWRASAEMLSENWLVGLGPGMFQETYLALQNTFPPYLEWAVPTPHNIGLAVWLSSGIAGLFGFLLILLYAGRRMVSEPKYIAASVALAAILVHGFVDTPFLKNDLSILLLLLML